MIMSIEHFIELLVIASQLVVIYSVIIAFIIANLFDRFYTELNLIKEVRGD